ncbi:MAG TPA: oligosaccharide flippase family protein [Burkholderiaceae bacterium]|nr:oligosaccharide flippase family protein [Burkholderiaceae bacterium]
MTVSSSLPAASAARSHQRAAMSATALRNLLWLSGDKLVSVTLGLLVFGLIARHFGPGGAGQFSYGVAVLQTALGLSLVCSSAAVLPRLCQLRDGTAASTVANVFVVRLIASLTAATVVAVYALLAIDDPARRTVTLVMVATVPLLEPFQAFSAYWLSRNQNRLPVLARGSGLAARLAVVAVALWAGAPTWVVALAWVAEALVSATLQSTSLRAVRPLRALFNAVRSPRVAPYFKFGVRFTAGLWLSHLFLRMDRLWLAERMDAHAFGLYATAMQLVEVWLQVATLMAGSMAPAFLYRALRHSTRLRDHWRTLLLLAGIGLLGLLGAVLIGPLLLTKVFGTPFAASAGYLVAGFAAAVLFFVDQFVQISITANNQPGLLAAKWAAACMVGLATLIVAAPHIAAYAGPLGLTLGLVAGWIVTWLGRRHAGARQR